MTEDIKGLVERLRSKSTDCHASEEELYLEAASALLALQKERDEAREAFEELMCASMSALPAHPDDKIIDAARLAEVEKERDELLKLNERFYERIHAAEKERDEMRAVIAWANNSLYGSHGFFLSLNGGPADEHHLDRGIEDLKERSRKLYKVEKERDEALEQWAKAHERECFQQRRAEEVEQERDEARAALKAAMDEWNRVARRAFPAPQDPEP